MDATPVTLSAEAESRLVFWSSPDDSLHPVSVVCAVTDLAGNTLTNLRVAGEGPDYIKRGGKIYYRKASVVRWMSGEGLPRPVQARDARSAA